MWYWIIKVSILSLIFIFLLHYLYSFFVSTLTVPKVKDLVTLPQEKYNEMFHLLQEQQQRQSFQRANQNDGNVNQVASANANIQSMKEDLIHFLKDLGSDANSKLKPTSFNNLNAFDSYDSNISSFSFSK